MNIIICGCGRVGSQLALRFNGSADSVVVVDRSPASFRNLGQDFSGRTVTGVAFDEDVLAEAGIDEADVVAAVTDSDNSNLMIAEVASKLHTVPHVLVRLYNPSRADAYLQLGLDYVCGTELVADAIYDKITSEYGGFVTRFYDYEVMRFALDLSSIGAESVTIDALEQPHRFKIIAFSRKDSSANSIPDADSILKSGDIVLACVHHSLLPKINRFMSFGQEG
ncbi:MAG: TrkA family potassium uptake protein [Coriobacteriales bacterium]|jgi:trk system potassium uptake protein TrkA|nr:TrkA family potassium uptake protein [Coriobacteriales bacterium]